MDLTDRMTRILLGAMTLGAVLVPATVAAAQPLPGADDLTDDPCDPVEEDCSPDPDPDPECPPFVATCDELTSDPCDPVEEDCSPDPEPDPDPEPEPEVDPDPEPEPEPVDPSVPADPNFTG